MPCTAGGCPCAALPLAVVPKGRGRGSASHLIMGRGGGGVCVGVGWLQALVLAEKTPERRSEKRKCSWFSLPQCV